MPEKTLAQLDEALRAGDISKAEHRGLVEEKRERNRTKQKKYRERARSRDSEMKLVNAAVPKAIMNRLTELSESSGVAKRTLIELALAQFLERRGIKLD
jgi:hypothetical protein